jgi:hypothetical protein
VEGDPAIQVAGPDQVGLVVLTRPSGRRVRVGRPLGAVARCPAPTARHLGLGKDPVDGPHLRHRVDPEGVQLPGDRERAVLRHRVGLELRSCLQHLLAQPVRGARRGGLRRPRPRLRPVLTRHRGIGPGRPLAHPPVRATQRISNLLGGLSRPVTTHRLAPPLHLVHRRSRARGHPHGGSDRGRNRNDVLLPRHLRRRNDVLLCKGGTMSCYPSPTEHRTDGLADQEQVRPSDQFSI